MTNLKVLAAVVYFSDWQSVLSVYLPVTLLGCSPLPSH